MNRYSRLLLAGLLLLAAVTSATAETFKLKLSQVIALAGDQALGMPGALPQLEGQPQPIAQGKDGDGKELPPRILIKPYEFSGKVRWAISKNLLALQEQVKAFEMTRVLLVKEAAGGAEKIPDEDHAAISKFTAKLNAIMDDEVKLELTRLSQDDLKLDVNQIPFSVLTALAPILADK